MITRLPKVRYLLLFTALVIVLAGCELARPEGQISDPGPVSDLPPTLAPLGAETETLGEATAIPTIINVQPTGTPSTLSQDQVTDNPAEPAAPTSAPAVDLSAQSAATSGEVTAQEETGATADSLIGPGQQQEAPVEEAAQESIVVDAPDTDLPIGGPVAANPPTSPTEGGYAAPGYATGASYMVQPGDTLFNIAQRYGTTVEALIYANGLSSDVIQAGQVLNIAGDEGGGYTQPNFGQAPSEPYNNAPYQQPPFVPGNGNFHTVAPGETLFAISSRYGAPLEAIAAANGLDYPYTLGIGQQLIIPSPVPYSGDNFGSAPGNVPGQAPFAPGAPLHSVAPGETLFAIASQYGIPMEVMAEANGLAYPYTLSIGQQLVIPTPISYPGNNNPGSNYPGGNYPDNSFGQGNFMPPANNSPVAPGNGYIHSVAPGENLFGIAGQYGTTVEAIASANGIAYPYVISIGQQLAIPAPGNYPGPQTPPTSGYYQQPYPAQPPVQGNLPGPSNPYAPMPGNSGTHTVAPGETLFSIANLYGTNAETLAAANGLSNPNQLFVGQVLYLP